MDPQANWNRQVRLADMLVNKINSEITNQEYIEEILDLRTAMACWISRGGFRPEYTQDELELVHDAYRLA